MHSSTFAAIADVDAYTDAHISIINRISAYSREHSQSTAHCLGFQQLLGSCQLLKTHLKACFTDTVFELRSSSGSSFGSTER